MNEAIKRFWSIECEDERVRRIRSLASLSQFRLDDANVASLIAILMKGHEEQAIAEARYVTDPGGRLAEAAVVIADEWQNLGLGIALLSDLIAGARRQGLSQMFAYFDVDNRSIIHVGQKVGFKLAPKEGATNYSMMKAEIAL